MVPGFFLLRIVIEDYVDYRSSNTNNKNNIIDGRSTIVNKVKQKRSSSRKPCFRVPSLKNKCFVLPSILFLLTLGILIFVLIGGNNHINKLKNKTEKSKINSYLK
jgi:hypothetical protein